MAKLNSSEQRILDEVAGWKGESPSFLNRATDVVSKPINWLTGKLIPDNVREGAAAATDKIAEKLQDVSQYTVDKASVLKATREFEIDSETILELKKASIFDLDNVAQKFIDNNTRVATISGAGTGMVGWAGLLADLPTLFMLSLRTIHQIAICYGFDLEDENNSEAHRNFETGYMMRVFKVATSSDVVQKQRGLSELKDYEAGRELELEGGVGNDFATKQVSKNATKFLSQRIIREIVEQTISKKAAALVPGLGAVFSAGFNYVYLKDVGEAAFMLYRERFLLDKKGRCMVINIEIE
ncbi:MAG: EcsC family protein [Bacteroidota bacterium]